MSGHNFPEFYVSRPEDSDDLVRVYYKVTDEDPEGHVFWRRENSTRSRETTFYDMFLEEKNGFGLERVERGETPWAE